jgi:CheY-like chemotaxis protein
MKRAQQPGTSMFKECVILHVDDDANDSTVFQRVLMSKGYNGTYRRVRRVEIAKDYLNRHGCYSDAALFPQPDIIVTELSIHGGDGIALIRWIRRQKSYQKTSVIAFSACTNAKMQQQSIDAGATCLIEKTPDYADLIIKVREIVEYRPTGPLSRLLCIVGAFNFFWSHAMNTLEISDELIEIAF